MIVVGRGLLWLRCLTRSDFGVVLSRAGSDGPLCGLRSVLVDAIPIPYRCTGSCRDCHGSHNRERRRLDWSYGHRCDEGSIRHAWPGVHAAEWLRSGRSGARGRASASCDSARCAIEQSRLNGRTVTALSIPIARRNHRTTNRKAGSVQDDIERRGRTDICVVAPVR